VIRSSIRLLVALAMTALIASPVLAQDDEDDSVLKLAEPDFSLVSMPTSLRLPKYKSAFRVTHRFLRSLNDDFGDVAGDFFGLDNGAAIGLEFRMGVIKNGQLGFHRSSDNKTIEFFGQYGVLRESKAKVDVSAFASIEGTDNFQESKSPALGAVISRTVKDWAAFYVQPIWVNNTNQLPSALVDDNSTFIVGLGTRIRVRPTVYVVAEVAPRAAGYAPDDVHASLAVEKRAGGHAFQLNFSTSSATTPAQLGRGGASTSEWMMGFNISRKFF
jgi:hypothetical protein